jgi:hypothetical protein
LLALLPQRPGEFMSRAAASLAIRLDPYVRTRPTYPVEEWSSALSVAGAHLGADLVAAISDGDLGAFEAAIRERLRTVPADAPFPAFHNGDFRMARLCYGIVRALRPACVIETGVCYGVTSSFILRALERNAFGTLYSIDLPPLGPGASGFVGWLVPAELRARWRLLHGSSKGLLPRLVSAVGAVDVFLHDSLHTYRNIRRELETVAPKLSPRSVVVADDIEGNRAFGDWASQSRPSYWAVVSEEAKDGLLGLGVFNRGAGWTDRKCGLG